MVREGSKMKEVKAIKIEQEIKWSLFADNITD